VMGIVMGIGSGVRSEVARSPAARLQGYTTTHDGGVMCWSRQG